MKLPAQLPSVAGDRQGKFAYADGITGAGLFGDLGAVLSNLDSVFGSVRDVPPIASGVSCRQCQFMPSAQERAMCYANCRFD